MNILLLVACLLLLAVTAGILVAASRHDADGYEDEFGFHFGSDGRH